MRSISLALFALVLGAPGVHAQSLVRDINQQPAEPEGLFPRDILRVGNTTYFQGLFPEVGFELGLTDGTLSGTRPVGDLAPGPAGLGAVPLGEFQGDMIFRGSGGLWRTDGTEQGTIFLGPASGTEFVELNGTLFVAAGDGLYITDGTADSAELVKEGPFEIQELTAYGSVVLFRARQIGFAHELWRSDGTEAGTFLVRELQPGIFTSALEYLTPYDGFVFFSAYGPAGWGIWRTDGTFDGTVEVFSPATGGAPNDLEAEHLTVLGSHLFFIGANAAGKRTLWRSDGTAAGTEDIFPTGSNFIAQLVASDGRLYFDPIINGVEQLWTSDGTTLGTEVVSDFVPNLDSPYIGYLTPIPSGITCLTGEELWAVNGLTASLIKTFADTGASTLNEFVAAGNEVLFAADDGTTGPELWSTDGTVAGTHVIVDTFTPGATEDARPYVQLVWNGVAFLDADDGVHGRETWVTDGTSSGTTLLLDAWPGPDGLGATSFTAFGDRVYFHAAEFRPDPPGSVATIYGVWQTDGTPLGTTRVGDGTLVPGDGFVAMAATRNALFFTASSASTAHGLWRLDAPGATPQLIAEFPTPSGIAGIRELVVENEELFFIADDGSGYALWHSDGTASGTAPILSPNGGLESIRYLTPLAGEVFFEAETAAEDWQIWSTDGSTTQSATTFLGSNLSSLNAPLATFGEYLVFESDPKLLVTLHAETKAQQTLSSAFNSADLWTESGDRMFFTSGQGSLLASDGTASGTTLLYTGPFAARIQNLTRDGSTGNGVYFTQYVNQPTQPPSKTTLWRSDGTVGGTAEIADLDPQDELVVHEFGTMGELTPVGAGPELLFTGIQLGSGTELWLTDGTVGGESLAADVAAGATTSEPENIVRLGDQLLYVADDGVRGQELHSLPFASTGGSALDPFGRGCLGTNDSVPFITVGGPAHLGGTLDFSVEGTPPLSLALLYFSLSPTTVPVGECISYLGSPFFFVRTRLTDLDGIASYTIPLTPDPILIALPLHYQWIVLDDGGPFLGIGSLSDALEVLIGP